MEPDLHAKDGGERERASCSPTFCRAGALAVAEAAGNQPGQAKGQVLVQQVVNAPNDGGDHANAPALKVSCFISFSRVFKFPHLAGFRFSLEGGKIVVLCLRGGKLLVLFTPVWRHVCIFMPVWC